MGILMSQGMKAEISVDRISLGFGLGGTFCFCDLAGSLGSLRRQLSNFFRARRRDFEMSVSRPMTSLFDPAMFREGRQDGVGLMCAVVGPATHLVPESGFGDHAEDITLGAAQTLPLSSLAHIKPLESFLRRVIESPAAGAHSRLVRFHCWSGIISSRGFLSNSPTIRNEPGLVDSTPVFQSCTYAFKLPVDGTRSRRLGRKQIALWSRHAKIS